jgi:hypothetical protein
MIDAIIQKLPGAYNGGRIQPSGQLDLSLVMVASNNSICSFHVSATLGGRSRPNFLVHAIVEFCRCKYLLLWRLKCVLLTDQVPFAEW